MKKIHHDTIMNEIEEAIRNSVSFENNGNSHVVLNLIQAYKELDNLGLIHTQEETKQLDEVEKLKDLMETEKINELLKTNQKIQDISEKIFLDPNFTIIKITGFKNYHEILEFSEENGLKIENYTNDYKTSYFSLNFTSVESSEDFLERLEKIIYKTQNIRYNPYSNLKIIKNTENNS